jgi:hypothetical protein
MADQRIFPHVSLATHEGLADLFARGAPTHAPLASSPAARSDFDFTALGVETQLSRISGIEQEVLLMGHLTTTWPRLGVGPVSDPLVIQVGSGWMWLLESIQGVDQRRPLFVNSSFSAFESCLKRVQELAGLPMEDHQARRQSLQQARKHVVAADSALHGIPEEDSLWLSHITSSLMDIDLSEEDEGD